MISQARSALAALLVVLLLGGCSSVVAGYHTPNANVVALQSAGASKLATGEFTAAAGQESTLNNLTLRGHSFVPANNGSFADYVREALNADLRQSDRYDPQSRIVVYGVLEKNMIDGSGFDVGQAEIAVRFKVDRDRNTVFTKLVSQHREWESSFMGPIAIPTAATNYGATVGALIDQLFRDPEFREATK